MKSFKVPAEFIHDITYKGNLEFGIVCNTQESQGYYFLGVMKDDKPVTLFRMKRSTDLHNRVFYEIERADGK